MFLSSALNGSLAKGLINSYAGQLKHMGCDQFCSTDSEVTQNAILDRDKTQSHLPSDLAANGAGSPGCGGVQTELRQLEEDTVTFLEMSCSVHPFSCPGFGRRELGLAAQIEISAVEPETEKPQLLC